MKQVVKKQGAILGGVYPLHICQKILPFAPRSIVIELAPERLYRTLDHESACFASSFTRVNSVMLGFILLKIPRPVLCSASMLSATIAHMFSSLLPNVASSMKFSQNGQSKPTNRFSVRVFKTSTSVPFPYPLTGKMDINYRAPQPPPPPPPPPLPQREQQNLNWYPASSYNTYDQRPRATANYAIYPSATNDNTFIYEQSTCSKSDIFSTSELDTASMTTFSPSSAFSPALSSDSTLALQSTPMESQRIVRPATPAVRSGYPHAGPQPQGAALSRTASTSHHAHEVAMKTESIEDHRHRINSIPARTNTPFRAPLPSIAATTAIARVPSSGGFVEIPEYAASSMSELAVEERDRIAKINAEYNSASTGSFYTSSSASSTADRRMMSTTPQNSPNFAKENLSRVASSQPLHPGLQFPVKSLEPEFTQPSRSNIRHDSPPSVERLPSQIPAEHPAVQPVPSTQHYPPPIANSRSRDAGYREPIRRTSPQNAPEVFDANSSRSGYATYPTSSQDTSPERRRKSSVTGPRPDIAGQRPISEFRDYGPYVVTDHRQHEILPPKSASEPTSSAPRDYGSRDRRDVAQSPIRENGVQSSSRTPSPRGLDDLDYRLSRRDSYVPDPARSSKDNRGGYPDHREVYTSGPLSSSPTQIRQNPVDVDTSEAPYPERMRTRSTSFSATNRPNLPMQNVTSDSRRVSGYDRVPDRVPRGSVYVTEEIEMQRGQRSDSERRNDHSQAPYFTQAAPLPPISASAYDTRSSQAQLASSMPQRPSSRAMDRTVFTQQNVGNSYSRSSAQDPSSSRSQAPYPEPTYSSQPIDGSRGRLDSERQYATNSGSQAPRSAVPASAKVAEAAGNARAGVPIGTAGSEPQRRYSDGDQNPPIKPQLSGRNSAPLLRSVRWNENLICPSPLFANQRRKGWFNRRGDQLWTNDGAYKAAAAGQEYPPDLDDYPEKEEGWMNEECIRIDLNHRLVPKPPLRSALKQARA